MQQFIRKLNLAEYCELLATTTDEYQRRNLLRLLAKEADTPPDIKEVVRKANIAELLATTTDEYQRRILLRLVAEEGAKGPAARLVINREPDNS